MENDDSPRLLRRDTLCWLLITGVLTATYAIVRYNIFKGVEWIHLPLYITNKATSWTAVVLIAASYLVHKRTEGQREVVLVKFLGLTGFSLAGMHVVMSLIIFSEHYYPEFFGAGKLNLTGELSMLCGVFGIVFLTVPAVTSLPQMQDSLGLRRWRRSQSMGYLALGCVAMHLLIMGIAGWMEPSEWPGHMPPITLLGFLAAITPLVVKLARAAPSEESGVRSQESEWDS